MTKLTRAELGEMAMQLTSPAVSNRATLVDAAAAIAACEAFARALCGHQVNLEHVEKRARDLVQSETAGELAEAELAVLAVRQAAAAAAANTREGRPS